MVFTEYRACILAHTWHHQSGVLGQGSHPGPSATQLREEFCSLSEPHWEEAAARQRVSPLSLLQLPCPPTPLKQLLKHFLLGRGIFTYILYFEIFRHTYIIYNVFWSLPFLHQLLFLPDPTPILLIPSQLCVLSLLPLLQSSLPFVSSFPSPSTHTHPDQSLVVLLACGAIHWSMGDIPGATPLGDISPPLARLREGAGWTPFSPKRGALNIDWIDGGWDLSLIQNRFQNMYHLTE